MNCCANKNGEIVSKDNKKIEVDLEDPDPNDYDDKENSVSSVQ